MLRHGSARAACTIAVCAAPLAVGAQEAAETHPAAIHETSVGIDYTYVSFRGDTDPWKLTAFSLSRRTDAGSIIGRVTYANRFATNGVQVEADAYPHLSSRTYAYLNAGYSGSTIFPEWRFGAELFGNLPDAWEASAGFRQLRFGGAPVTLLTGSVGKYIGNYWFSVRPFVRQKPSGTSASGSLTARRYFEDGDHYIGARVSYGNTPSDRLTPDEVNRSNSFSAGVHGSTGLARRLLGTWSLGYDHEELAPFRIRESVTASAGLKLTF